MDAELELCCRLCARLCAGRRVKGVAISAPELDLCLFFEEPPDPELRALVVATGAERRRVGLEPVRLARDAQLAGAQAERLQELVGGTTLRAVERAPGERRVSIRLEGAQGKLELVAELFGPKGYWFCLDAKGRILAQSAKPGGARAFLVPGARYEPPAARAQTDGLEPEEPAEPLAFLHARATRFAALDAAARERALRARLERALAREAKGIAARLAGLAERARAEEGAEALRQEADLLLASPEAGSRGLASLRVADWFADGEERELGLDPKLTVRQNAERRYERARRLRAGRERTRVEQANAEERRARCDAMRTRLEDAGLDRDALAALAPEIEAIVTRKKQRAPRRAKRVKRVPFRRFKTLDGLDLLVGRTNADNDRLTKSIARGNDLWLHVAGGFAGSHVVLRLAKDQSPPQESLLDAAHLALHFSKARGKRVAEVLYTRAKEVRKPKGAPPGRVEVLRSKTLSLRVEDDRLLRLLDSVEGHE